MGMAEHKGNQPPTPPGGDSGAERDQIWYGASNQPDQESAATPGALSAESKLPFEVQNAITESTLDLNKRPIVTEIRSIQQDPQGPQGFLHKGDVQSVGNARPERNAQSNPAYEKLMRRYLRMGIYNQITDEEGHVTGHLDLAAEPELRKTLRDAIAELAQKGLIRVIIPFVTEPQAGLAVEYNAQLVGTENIVAIESGTIHPDKQEKRRRAIAHVQDKGVEVYNQRDVVDRIPWRKLREIGALRSPEPHEGETSEQFHIRYEQEMDLPPEASKGLTLFAGVATLYAKDRNARIIRDQGGTAGSDFNPHDILEDDTIIMLHDSDIGNQWDYDATTHAAGFPVAFPPSQGQFRSAQMAFLGRGRNNEPIAGEVNVLANLGYTPIERKLGRALQPIIWHLTGERWFRWGDLKKKPFATGMGEETVDNFFMAGQTITEGSELRAQITAVEPKREYDPVTNEPEESLPDREFDMVYMLQIYYQAIARACAENDAYLHQWTIEDYARFNRTFGGRFVFNTVNGPLSDHSDPRQMASAKAAKVKRLDQIIPPLALLDALDLLPINELVSIQPHESKPK